MIMFDTCVSTSYDNPFVFGKYNKIRLLKQLYRIYFLLLAKLDKTWKYTP